MTDAVIFDLDGVLVDSEPVWERVRRAYVAERGGRWLQDTQSRLMGMSTQEWATYLSEDLRVGLSPHKVAEQVVDRMAERYAEELPLLSGAVETVRRLGARWPLGLASSSPRRLIDTVIAGAGLDDAFQVTRSTEEGGRGKPAPDVYLWVAERLGTDPSRTVAIEDSSNGLRSAAAAGMRVVAIPRPPYPPAEDALAGATYVARDLDDLTVERIGGLAG